jgi:type I restriction-modification system DNA methylase subunit
VDYGFYINGRIKFYLEAKSLKEDLNREDYARQAIRYSFNKGATWAILTDFESIKVFNAQAISKYLGDKLYFEIPYNEYISRLDQLLLLSKESFQSDLIDVEAKRVGKMLQKMPVGELLFEDLEECREILIHDLSLWNEKVDKELLDEGVQKILDRLIFLRVAEDRKIEPPTLIPLIRAWENTDRKIPLYKSMISTFRELDSVYNSNLFSKHPFEDWEDYSDATKKVINILYGKEGYYEYDFKAMPADVLGGVYENYLGYKLSQSKKGLAVGKNAKKRKEQGIYYTPTFIVDYIVRNALKPVLDRCKSVGDLKKIKVLDPACGSGSFLIKALEIIADKYQDFNCKVDEFTKIEIIMENLYGVDLDMQAVEIARLNLLINTLEQRGIMPSLDKNIKNGNSLISGADEELEKYFGKNFRDKKPFNWNEEFPEVFKQGGFDVIIGNPPWVSLKGKHGSEDVSDDEIKYFSDHYTGNTYAPNLYELFIWKALSLLAKDGMLSLIVPDRLLANEQYALLRKKILENFTILKLWLKVDFPGVIADTVIFVLQNSNPLNNVIEFLEYPNEAPSKVKQSSYLNGEDNSILYVDDNSTTISKKLSNNENFAQLVEFANTTSGCGAKSFFIHEAQQSKHEMRIIKGENIQKYKIIGYFWFEFKDENLSGRTRDIEKLGVKEKILLRKTGIDLIATFDNSGIYPEQSLYFVYGADTETLLYLLALLNSKFVNYYYHNFAVTNKNSTPQLKNIDLDKFPIPKASEAEKKNIVILSKKMLSLNNDLNKIPEHSEKWEHLKNEIEKTDKKIDEEVYKLYDLTTEETETVEKG